ncbi:MAG: hypothetical protein JO092_11715 [Candidatus Eremiobacteraeota bacterium]|nr:hypothetical protein [Candidatus Eremiobacteraeota bacterium]
MRDRAQAGRYLLAFACSAVGALLVWLLFHGVYASLTQAAAAVGYVDSGAQIGIALSYLLMVGGTSALGIVALWAAYKLVTLGRGTNKDA